MAREEWRPTSPIPASIAPSDNFSISRPRFRRGLLPCCPQSMVSMSSWSLICSATSCGFCKPTLNITVRCRAPMISCQISLLVVRLTIYSDISAGIPVNSEFEEARSLQYRCECIETACLEQGELLPSRPNFDSQLVSNTVSRARSAGPKHG